MDLLIIGDRAATVRRGRMGRLQAWPDGDSPVTADLAGRVWGLDPQGELIRR